MEFHEYANLFPMMSDAEIQDMANSMRKEYDKRYPILTYQGKILDGRNRWQASQIAGITPLFSEYVGDDPLGCSVRGNLLRRHLSESQRGIVASKLANLCEGRPNETTAPIGAVSQPKAAAMLNVGRMTVQRAASVVKKGTPELISAVESGRITVNAACEIAKLPAFRQSEVLAEGTDAIKEKAKEIRENGGAEIAPAPTNSTKRIVYQPCLGMEIVSKAIATMGRIGDTDKQFESAYQAMLDHCNIRMTRRKK